MRDLLSSLQISLVFLIGSSVFPPTSPGCGTDNHHDAILESARDMRGCWAKGDSNRNVLPPLWRCQNFSGLRYSPRSHYGYTLDHWADSYEKNVEKVRHMFDESFVRMWRLFLHACSAGFKYGSSRLYQILFSKGLMNGLPLTRKHLY
jgi:hypothetical protein